MKQIPAADLLHLTDGWEIAYDTEFGLLYAEVETVERYPAYVAWVPVIRPEYDDTNVILPVAGERMTIPFEVPVVVREVTR